MAQNLVRTETYSATSGRAITPDTPFKACRAVSCGGEGAGTVTWLDGSTSSYYFTLGINPVQIINVAASGLAATNLVALY